eukprot:4718210-Prymnesium_polylepis.1
MTGVSASRDGQGAQWRLGASCDSGLASWDAWGCNILDTYGLGSGMEVRGGGLRAGDVKMSHPDLEALRDGSRGVTLQFQCMTVRVRADTVKRLRSH